MLINILLITILILLVANIILSIMKRDNNNNILTTITQQLKISRTESSETSQASRKELSETLNKFEEKFSKNITDVRETVYKELKEIRGDNNKQLERIRHTVDEKLEKTLEKRLGDSFKLVSERLELVHKGLGEMQTIATGVGDLKKVLSNVKTRGIFGEYLLENILEQILTQDQYGKNVSTKDNSEHVEFAIKMPGQGKSKDEMIWLPIDSKFPLESYNTLIDSYEDSDKEEIEKNIKNLSKAIELFAKEISAKYLNPPVTTDFAIMFLPTEGLYAEALRHPGLLDDLRNKYKVILTGPTTLAALLNSLQMGFRTLAVQKRSSEVWRVLEEIKNEFDKFALQLDKVDKQLNTASKSLGELRNTRTNVMKSKMKNVATIDTSATQESLAIDDIVEIDED